MDIRLIDNNKLFKVRVSGIIIKDNKILVDEYGDNSFCLPGGYALLGEDSKQALLRELKEETNIDFHIDKYLGIIENFYTNIRGYVTHSIDFYYEVSAPEYNIDMHYREIDNGNVIEHNYTWISIDNIEKYNILPNMIKDIIKNNEINFHYINK